MRARCIRTKPADLQQLNEVSKYSATVTHPPMVGSPIPGDQLRCIVNAWSFIRGSRQRVLSSKGRKLSQVSCRGRFDPAAILASLQYACRSDLRANFARLESEGFPTACQ